MNFKDIASRLTGISTPFFGASWKPSETDRSIVRRVITFLEDRRVLYSPSELEMPAHCVESVLQIRGFLIAEIEKLDEKADLTASLRAMRAACRKFLNTVQADEGRIIHFGADTGHYANWTFNSALGEMRGVFGIHIARLAAAYGVDVENDLAAILPERDLPGNNTAEPDAPKRGVRRSR